MVSKIMSAVQGLEVRMKDSMQPVHSDRLNHTTVGRFAATASAIRGAKDIGRPKTVAMKPQNFMKSLRLTPFSANLSGTSINLSIINLLAWTLEYTPASHPRWELNQELSTPHCSSSPWVNS